jgi:type III restriction enzyme
MIDEPGAPATMVKAISSNVASYVTIKTVVHELRQVVVEELQPQLLEPGRRLSETPKFPWSRATTAASECIYNLVPCDNQFEKEFARFLEQADDVARFAKLPEQFRFCIEYTDAVGNLRYYEPDFVAVTEDGKHHLIETKGLEDINVASKDRAALLWCENATARTGTPWDYVKVRQTEFNSLQPMQFADVLVQAQ